MLSLMNKGIEPSAPSSDPITYLTSINYLQSITNDNGPTVEKVKDLLSTPKTRLHGLLLLRLALEQNSDVYVKGKWPVVLNDILNDSVTPIIKEHACDIFCMLLPYMSRENEVYSLELRNFYKEMFPLLLTQIDEDVEWSKTALKCIHMCLKHFPRSLLPHKDRLLSIILKKISYCVSSEIFEVITDCFSELPNVVDRLSASTYAVEWKKQYLTTLNTLQQLLDTFGTLLPNEPFDNSLLKIECGTYVFPDDNDENSKDVHRAYMKGSRRYVNLCKCLSKMLSSQSKCSVEVPLKLTLITTTRLFQVQDFKNIKPTSTELQIFFSVLSQMQVASLIVLESLILNFNVLPYSSSIADLMQSALASSKLTNITLETISQIRHAVWKILKLFIKKYGSKASGDIIKLHSTVIQELLEDISVEEKSSQTSANQKQRKNAANSGKKRLGNEDRQKICREALETLEQLAYTGAPYFIKSEFQEIFSKVLQVASALRVSFESYPYPYDDELCRKNLYSVLLAFTVISNLDQSELAQCAVGLFKNALQDPSVEVTGFCNIAMAVLNSKIHPKRPPPKYKISADKQRPVKVSSAIVKCPEWSSDDFVPNLPLENIPKEHESVTSRLTRTVHDPNDGVAIQEELIEEEVETEPHYSEQYAECYESKYSEQGAENHHNGEDVLEMRHSNQCHDDVESEDEEEEEEDDERSYGDEEMDQGEIPPETVYIPSPSVMQGITPLHITPETVPQNVDQEYEQLRPCAKTEGTTVDSNKIMHLNGSVRNIVPPDVDVPSSSTQPPSLANENGGYMYEEEDLEEEEGDEDEEEENVSFPAEKRVPAFYPTNPPSKRQRLETNDESKNEPQDDESPRSPTLTEMKADFCCNEIDDVKS